MDVFCDAACAVLQTALARISSVGLWMCFVMRSVDVFCDAACVMQYVDVFCDAACAVCGCVL